MSRTLDNNTAIPESRRGDPAWAIATLFPTQGEWSEDDYFRLETQHFIELANGCLEVHAMPTWLHQRIVAFLYRKFSSWCVTHRRGEVLFAPLPLKLFPGTIREPDILIVKQGESDRVAQKYPTDAILIAEVVSEDDKSRKRDLIEKRHDYAVAGIPEYWIIDPVDRVITVLVLDGNEYREHSKAVTGQKADSALFGGFAIKADDIWILEHQG